MDPAQLLPSRDRLSVLTAIILLAYTLMRFMRLPERLIGGMFFGSPLSIKVNGTFLMMLLVAALISTGSDMLIRSHPNFARQPTGRTLIHWILPGATALVLAAALNRAPNGLVWGFGLGASALVLLAVFVAEYSVIHPHPPVREAASFALTALTYGLTLTLFILLHSLSVRAAISATIGGGVAGALAWRLFSLRKAALGRAGLYAAIVGLICAEVIWALNYWRVPSNSAALMVMIPFYIGVGVAQQHLAGQLTRRVWIEFAIVGALGLLVALIYTFA